MDFNTVNSSIGLIYLNLGEADTGSEQKACRRMSEAKDYGCYENQTWLFLKISKPLPAYKTMVYCLLL
ncbi:hypothetical protein OC25_20895 [Pedobacter kyungheensis]|uniref:Uncharacterized protein n=1 Tax=Pedobacter kyungheensis TaxID=1069985 RepID=A0A0C1FI90_9SPHI|nr:hypothetical protein OC25_20895 [Pedobacter kyungheensis]